MRLATYSSLLFFFFVFVWLNLETLFPRKVTFYKFGCLAPTITSPWDISWKKRKDFPDKTKQKKPMTKHDQKPKLSHMHKISKQLSLLLLSKSSLL